MLSNKAFIVPSAPTVTVSAAAIPARNAVFAPPAPIFAMPRSCVLTVPSQKAITARAVRSAVTATRSAKVAERNVLTVRIAFVKTVTCAVNA